MNSKTIPLHLWNTLAPGLQQLATGRGFSPDTVTSRDSTALPPPEHQAALLDLLLQLTPDPMSDDAELEGQMETVAQALAQGLNKT